MDGIVCKSLSKSYDKKSYALSKLSLSFPENGIIAMIGLNGAGKTTLIRISKSLYILLCINYI